MNQMFSDVWHFWSLWPGERQEATRDQGRWAGTSEERPGNPGCARVDEGTGLQC